MAYKKFFLIFTILIFSGCMGMMMHGTDHNHNTGDISEVKTIDTTKITADSTPAITQETQKPHHEEISEKRSIITWGGVGMAIMMVFMMGRFIF